VSEWNPYEWHDRHKPGKPRWRVKAGMAEQRHKLCEEFGALNERMGQHHYGMRELARWEQLKAAILACEEFEDGSSTADPRLDGTTAKLAARMEKVNG